MITRPKSDPLFSAEEILQLQKAVRRVPVADHVYDYVVRLVNSTRPGMAKCRMPHTGCSGAPVPAQVSSSSSAARRGHCCMGGIT